MDTRLGSLHIVKSRYDDMRRTAMHIYRGCNITRATSAGFALPWSAYVNGHFVYADTLAGVKELIRLELSK
jgi:hypothetical protein